MSDYRITFSKKGALSFISHLDFNHSFIRILKRAQLPLKYSEGYNPRPKIVFGLPLSVGMEGENEIVDIALTEDLSCEEVYTRLSAAVPDEMLIKAVSTPSMKVKNIELAVYTVVFFDFHADVDKMLTALAAPPAVMKHSKSGDKLTDIAPMLRAYRVEISENDTVLHLTLTAFDSMYLNPDYVVASMREAGVELPEEFSVTRTAILFRQA